jgi:transcriptional regulator with XRE-family HTH domain
MVQDLAIGATLRRFRRLNMVKQSNLAELLSVSQGTVSRWESGTHSPDAGQRERLVELIAAHAGSDQDAALRRLIESSNHPVHLVCDSTHRLLAASASRVASWRLDIAELTGRSLWPFASCEIISAEEGLRDRGWFEHPYQRLEFLTAGNDRSDVPVPAGRLLWETLPLSDGRVGRLTTTIG